MKVEIFRCLLPYLIPEIARSKESDFALASIKGQNSVMFHGEHGFVKYKLVVYFC